MYSKQEASKLREEFWAIFGKYMTPITGADGIKINWVNYKTGVKNIYFKMNADGNSASISIQVLNNDKEKRLLYYNRLLEMKNIFNECLEEDWTWIEQIQNESSVEASVIYKEIVNISIFNRDDWPALITFFKPRIIAFDNFWSTVRYNFDDL